MQIDFFQRYGLSGWIFFSRQNTQWYLLDLSVLNNISDHLMIPWMGSQCLDNYHTLPMV